MKHARFSISRRTILVGLLIVVFHQTLLRFAALLLIAEDSGPSRAYTLVLGGDRSLNVAADRYLAQQNGRILLVESKKRRLQAMNIIPPAHVQQRRALIAQGMPSSGIEIINGETECVWVAASRLGAWLERNPDKDVNILCERFQSRHLDYVLGQTLDDALRERMQLDALPDRRYDENNWWQSRIGIRAYLSCAFDLGFTILMGKDKKQIHELDADLYENRVFEGHLR